MHDFTSQDAFLLLLFSGSDYKRFTWHLDNGVNPVKGLQGSDSISGAHPTELLWGSESD